ncbi:MAG: FliM/FliN family flagellar motor switch protein [Limnochordales bacterium]|nr:FliM/FliN family flagellar motor switch protein [Limnochordales bacterium]
MAVAREPAELPIAWRRYHHLLARRLATIISEQAGLLCRVEATEQGVYGGWQLMGMFPPLALAARWWVSLRVPSSRRRLPALFCFQSELAQVLVDRLLGGRGRWPEGARLLTALEAKVMRPLILRLWEATGELWPGATGVEFESVPEHPGSLSNLSLPGELRSVRELLAGHDATWIWWVARFTVQLPAGQGMASFCLPLELLERQTEIGLDEARRKDDQVEHRESREVAESAAAPHEVSAGQDRGSEERGADQPAQVTVVLGRVSLRAHDLLNLECGDIIKLEQPVEGEVTVYVNGRPAWLAQPGTFRGRLAVRLLRKHAAQEEVVSA